MGHSSIHAVIIPMGIGPFSCGSGAVELCDVGAPLSEVRQALGVGKSSIAIEIGGDGVSRRFPPHRLPLLYEWRDLHCDELLENCSRMRDGKAPKPIEPHV
jgi:hypothetical protein